MKLFHLYRDDKSGYDEAYQFVIAAPNEATARILAADECGDEGPRAWTIEAHCDLLAEQLEDPTQRVICRDFNAG